MDTILRWIGQQGERVWNADYGGDRSDAGGWKTAPLNSHILQRYFRGAQRAFGRRPQAAWQVGKALYGEVQVCQGARRRRAQHQQGGTTHPTLLLNSE